MSAPALRWYFDFVSPFSYLQWRKLRELAHERPVALVPIVFGAVLSAHAYLAAAPGRCRVLAVCSGGEAHLREAMARQDLLRGARTRREDA